MAMMAATDLGVALKALCLCAFAQGMSGYQC